jgi:glycosyltransferase involved in cell wall biosynthesis
MKIGLISLHAYALYDERCPHPHGGAEVQLTIIAHALQSRGDRVDLFVAAGMDIRSRVIDSVTIHNCSYRPARTVFGRFPQIIRLFLLLLKSDCDVYVQRNAGYETALVCLACRLKGKKFVYMVSHMIDCTGQYKQISFMRGLFFEYGLKRAHLVIAQSQTQKKALAERYGIESSVFPSSYPVPPRIQAVKDDHLLWVGRIVSWKRPQAFLEMAVSMPERTFIMIAPQSCSDSEYRSFTERLKPIKNLTYIPSVPFKDIDPYFASAKFFVNTSQAEGFPNTFIQAFMHGTPVISLCVDPDESIKKNGLGLVSESFTDIGSFLETCRTDKQYYQEMCERCYRYAMETHEINTNITKLVEIMKRVV